MIEKMLTYRVYGGVFRPVKVKKWYPFRFDSFTKSVELTVDTRRFVASIFNISLHNVSNVATMRVIGRCLKKGELVDLDTILESYTPSTGDYFVYELNSYFDYISTVFYAVENAIGFVEGVLTHVGLVM
ncbi:MAG: hypothetical protein QXT86_09985 [Archaeoglobaceae archaeon]